MKTRRQSAIRELVEREAVHSQEQLRRRLLAKGFDVTQATLSRDIKDLGLVKRSSDGAYQADGADAGTAAASVVTLAHALGEYLLSVEGSEQLLVLKTGPAQAQPLAIAFDRARLPEVIGTIAGDDTILLICRDARAAQATRRTIASLTAD